MINEWFKTASLFFLIFIWTSIIFSAPLHLLFNSSCGPQTKEFGDLCPAVCKVLPRENLFVYFAWKLSNKYGLKRIVKVLELDNILLNCMITSLLSMTLQPSPILFLLLQICAFSATSSPAHALWFTNHTQCFKFNMYKMSSLLSLRRLNYQTADSSNITDKSRNAVV